MSKDEEEDLSLGEAAPSFLCKLPFASTAGTDANIWHVYEILTNSYMSIIRDLAKICAYVVADRSKYLTIMYAVSQAGPYDLQDIGPG